MIKKFIQKSSNNKPGKALEDKSNAAEFFFDGKEKKHLCRLSSSHDHKSVFLDAHVQSDYWSIFQIYVVSLVGL